MTEGLPLLLMGLIPFALFGLYRSAYISLQQRRTTSFSLEAVTLPTFTWTIVVVTLMMSLISHKEARFLYPLLPCLHIISGNSVSVFTRRASIWKGFILVVILLLHMFITLYVSRTHQRGVLDVMHYLRAQHGSRGHGGNTTVAFLMPCHSTPWRSHFIDKGIDAWALTCEPPVNMSPDQRVSYVDEADIFYDNVDNWLMSNMESISVLEESSIWKQSKKIAEHSERTVNGQITGRNRPWPEYLVFFEHLEPQIGRWLATSPYLGCARMFNTHWHDDWRRKGDVVVYCLETPSMPDANSRIGT